MYVTDNIIIVIIYSTYLTLNKKSAYFTHANKIYSTQSFKINKTLVETKHSKYQQLGPGIQTVVLCYTEM